MWSGAERDGDSGFIREPSDLPCALVKGEAADRFLLCKFVHLGVHHVRLADADIALLDLRFFVFLFQTSCVKS